MNGENVTTTADGVSGVGSRRGALAAMLAGTALGLSSLGGAVSQDAEAKGKRGKKKRRNKNRKGGNGKGNGGVGASLPSVRFVNTTTTFTNSGVVSAFSKCPDGYLPISGGFFTSAPEPQLLTSSPRQAENDWEIEIDGANDGGEMTVIAICLAASDDSTDEDAQTASASRRKRKRSRKR